MVTRSKRKCTHSKYTTIKQTSLFVSPSRRETCVTSDRQCSAFASPRSSCSAARLYQRQRRIFPPGSKPSSRRWASTRCRSGCTPGPRCRVRPPHNIPLPPHPTAGGCGRRGGTRRRLSRQADAGRQHAHCACAARAPTHAPTHRPQRDAYRPPAGCRAQRVPHRRRRCRWLARTPNLNPEPEPKPEPKPVPVAGDQP